MQKNKSSDLQKINNAINRCKKNKISEYLGCSYGHFSYVLTGKRPLTKDMKERLFEYLGITITSNA